MKRVWTGLDVIDTQLYLITPPAFEVDDFAGQLTEALDGGSVACVQLRLKGATDAEIIAAAHVLMPICHGRDVAFIINDRPDIARNTGADGVHVGQNDISCPEARAIVGMNSIVGVSCHNSRHLSMTAAEQGADYVAFGAFFASNTKAQTPSADISLLPWWAELFETPCVAIGGITPDNARELITAGANFLAVCNGVWNHPDGPKVAVGQFNDLFNA